MISFNVLVIDLEYIWAIWSFSLLSSVINFLAITFKYVGIKTKFTDFIKTFRIPHRIDNSWQEK